MAFEDLILNTAAEAPQNFARLAEVWTGTYMALELPMLAVSCELGLRRRLAAKATPAPGGWYHTSFVRSITILTFEFCLY